MPTNTDLVTDLPADFEVFGQAVATSMADLLGGTTGQVLSKTTNADMDFTWVNQDDSNAIQNSIVDAKGDLIGATAADTPARLAVGTNGQILTADSAEATGLKWATPASSASGLTLVKTQTIGSAVSSVTVTSAFSATYDNYLITVSGGSGSTFSNTQLTLGSTTTSYYFSGIYMSYSSNTVNSFASSNGSNWTGTFYATGAHSGHINLQSPFLSQNTIFQTKIVMADTAGSQAYYEGFLNNTTSYTAFTLTAASGTMTGGTIRVYGYQNS